jgi:hypothetical protein
MVCESPAVPQLSVTQKIFALVVHYGTMRHGKDGKNVTSQETCLYRIDHAFVE